MAIFICNYTKFMRRYNYMRLFGQAIYYASYLVFPLLAMLGYFFYAKKEKREKIIALILIFISAVFIYARFIEPKRLTIEHTNITLADSSPLGIKIAVFADLHLGIYKNSVNLSKIVKKLNNQKPDITIIPGDFINYIDKENIEKELAPLSDIKCPVYAVTGNHDSGSRANLKNEIISALKKHGVFVMDNVYQNINIKGHSLTIIGLPDLWEETTNYNLLKGLKEEENVIVITHNPDTVYDFPPKIANIDLLISGHTHGGQIRLPFIYKSAIPTSFPFDKGLHTANNTKIFITSGIGMVGLPLRFLIPPKIDILNI